MIKQSIDSTEILSVVMTTKHLVIVFNLVPNQNAFLPQVFKF